MSRRHHHRLPLQSMVWACRALEVPVDVAPGVGLGAAHCSHGSARVPFENLASKNYRATNELVTSSKEEIDAFGFKTCCMGMRM